jgi:hypothetical protein
MIKQIGGWKTTSVFHRYAIVNRQDMATAMRQFEEHKARVGRTSEVETPESEFGYRLGTNEDFQAADTSQRKIQ